MPWVVKWKGSPTAKEWHEAQTIHRRKTIAKKAAQRMRNKYPGRYVRIRQKKGK